MARVLITGSSGFIGNALVDHLAGIGHDVIALYRRNPPRRAAVGRVTAIRRDIADGLDELPAVDCIIHAAADTHLNPELTARDYVRSNVLGTCNVADYAKQAASCPWVLHLSTITVYGRIDGPVLDEATPSVAPNLYGQTKRLAEEVLAESDGGFASLSVRLPGVVGPGYTTPWIGQVLDSCLTDRPVEIHNPDAPFNNIVDTEEIARLFDHLLRRGGIAGHDTVNLGATEPLSVRRAVDLVRTLADSRSDIVARASAAASFLIDTTKVQTRYGFKPAPTADIITRFVKANRRAPVQALSA